ncbi:MAG: L-threonylcarbamoyladenylate synthase [Cyanobacteriota bacterium]|nr:L-threonylcarbamoyladenylate synthase [Cyanobacteriota bacterium]
MSLHFHLHPEYPQPHLVSAIVEALRQGSIMLYPTDTVYAIGCDVTVKSAVERVRRLKQLSNSKPLTFLCPSLSQIAAYAQVSDTAYRLMKRLIPGPYTFLLPATKLVPKLLLDPKRKTTGIRVPDSVICQTLLGALGNPIVSTSAKLAGELLGDLPLTPDDLEPLEKQVDLIVNDSTPLRSLVSTVIDFTQAEPEIVRRGLGYDIVADLLA